MSSPVLKEGHSNAIEKHGAAVGVETEGTQTSGIMGIIKKIGGWIRKVTGIGSNAPANDNAADLAVHETAPASKAAHALVDSNAEKQSEAIISIHAKIDGKPSIEGRFMGLTKRTREHLGFELGDTAVVKKGGTVDAVNYTVVDKADVAEEHDLHGKIITSLIDLSDSPDLKVGSGCVIGKPYNNSPEILGVKGDAMSVNKDLDKELVRIFGKDDSDVEIRNILRVPNPVAKELGCSFKEGSQVCQISKANVQFDDGPVQKIIIIPEGDEIEIGEGAAHKLGMSSGISQLGAKVSDGVFKLYKDVPRFEKDLYGMTPAELAEKRRQLAA